MIREGAIGSQIQMTKPKKYRISSRGHMKSNHPEKRSSSIWKIAIMKLYSKFYGVYGLLREILSKGRLPEFILISIISLLFLAVLLSQTDIMTYEHPDFKNNWDHQKYIQMAEDDPFSYRYAPYCWRIAIPLIAGIMPFDLQWNFLLFSLIGIWGTGVTIYYVARKLDFSRSFAFIGMFMFFSIGWGAKLTLYDFWLQDAFSFLLITLAIYFILAKKDLYFIILLLLGVTVKETVIFIAPLYYTLNTLNTRKIFDLKLGTRTVLYALPAIIVLMSIRGLMTPENLDYGYWMLFQKHGLDRLQDFSTLALFKESVILYTIGTFGVMVTLLPFFSVKRNVPLFVRLLPFILLVYSQVLFASNTERLIVLAFPALILLALNGIDYITKKLTIKPIDFILLPILMFGLLLIRPDEYMPSLRNQAFIIILYLAFVFQIRRWKK